MKGEIIQKDDGRIFQDHGEFINIFIPMQIRRRSGKKEIIMPDIPLNEREPSPIMIALSRAHVWQKWIDSGKYANALELADAVGLDPSLIRRILRLGALSPKIVEEALDGKEPECTLQNLMDMDVPVKWEEQEEVFLP